MAYDNPGNAGEEMGGSEMTAEKPMHEKNTFHLSADMLPGGMAEKVNIGDILEFKVVAKPDGDGDVEVEYNYGEEKGEGMHDESGEAEGGSMGDQWAEDLRSEMSPRNNEQEAGY